MSKDDENLSVQPSLSPAAAAAGLGAEMARTSKCKTFLQIAMQCKNFLHITMQCKTFLHIAM